MESNCPILYHGTSLSGLVGIIASDELCDDGWESPYGCSFSRSFAIASGYAANAAIIRAQHAHPDFPTDSGEAHIHRENGSGGAVIEFDANLLRQQHEIIDFESWTGGQKPEMEQEERMTMKEGDCKGPVNYAIRKIHVVGGREVFERYAEFLEQAQHGKYTHVLTFIRGKLA